MLKILERASAEDLYCWFTVFARVGNCLPYSRLTGLLHTLLSFDWYSPHDRQADVLGAYSDALVQAVVGSKNVIGTVYDALTRRVRCKKNAVGDPEMTTTQSTILTIHSCLRRLLNVVPSSGQALLEALEASHPTKFDHPMDRLVYLEAVLLVSSYCEETSRGVLDLVVRNLLILDVDIEMDASDLGEELTFSLEEDADDDDARRKNFRQQEKAKADHMDLLLEKMFDFIDIQYLHMVQGVGIASINDFPPDCAKQAEFFRTMLHVFDSRVLTSPRAQFVQFLVFYACTKSPHVYAPIFLSHLISVFRDYSRDQKIRAAAAAYIGSFVSRFGRLNPESIASALTVLSDWAREYLERLQPGAVPDARTHHLFYVVCNCIFYIVCFRPQAAPSGFGYQITRIVDGCLNPLLFTLPRVREELEAVSVMHKLIDVSFLRTKLASNRGLISGLEGANFTVPYPFDPYQLSKGDTRLAPFYHQWNEAESDVPVIRSTGESGSVPCSDMEEEEGDEPRAMSLGTPLTGSFSELFRADFGNSNLSSSNNSPSFVV